MLLTNYQFIYKLTIWHLSVLIPPNMTKFVNKNQINNNWYEIDAKNAVVGRLATIISKIIRGKN